MEPNQNTKKIGNRQIIHSQARELISNIYLFMKRESQEGPILLSKVQERVAQATGISLRSVQRIIQERNTNEVNNQPFSTPRKRRPKKKTKSTLDDFDKCVVRRTIHDFHITHKKRPTLSNLLPVLKDKIDFKGSVWSLRKVIADLGFKWRKSVDNRKILIEKPDIREKRIKFLRAVKRYRSDGRPIVYTDETYVHSSHTQPHGWTDNSTSGLHTPISKGQYGIIVHAGTEKGFIDNSLLIFKSGQKSGDYHDAMNFNNYEKWLRQKLIPNLPPNSVVVIDNASYHNKQLNPAPTSSSKKSDMISWLQTQSIPFHDKMLKPELYQLVKLNKGRTKMFKIDSLLAEHGHSVLRLPPYHPDLNAIEMIWAIIKNYVAKNNTTFKTDDCIKLVNDKISSITSDDWMKRCKHVEKVEDEYLRLEPIIDENSERLVINLGEDSSSTEESDNEKDSSDNDDSDSDATLSGMEAL